MESEKNWAKENIQYSISRIDLMILSISGGGIYVCLELFKFCLEKEAEIDDTVVISGIFFLSSIVLNFFSQITGKMANTYHHYFLNAEDEADKGRYDANADSWDKANTILTYSGAGAMILGIILLVIVFISLA